MLDPIPDVRATSAKALGSIVGVGEEEAGVVELIPWLILTLSSDKSPVERAGAAQGLAEVLLTLGGGGGVTNSTNRISQVGIQVPFCLALFPFSVLCILHCI